MPDLLTQSFAPLLLAFQPCFTQPSFRSFWALVCAWILCSGRRSLTRVIQAAQLSQFKHYCSFHRFFSKARWNLDELGHCVLRLLLPFCSQLLVAAVDDTLARKSGRRIWGADMHHDPLRSTRARPFFSFGHNWVVFSLHISFPFAPHKHWALPILVRLYRKKRKNKLAPGRRGKWERKQTGQASPKQYRTRPQLALEMIQIVAGWVPDRLLHVTADSEYGGRAISRHLPANAHLISRMTMKAALYDVPPPNPGGRGRPRKKGKRLPSPLQMAEDPSSPWIKTILQLYGKRVRVLVQIRGCFVVLQRRPETAAYRRGARSFASTPRRLLLLDGPHTDSARHPHHVFSTLAPGSLLSRREAILGLRRSAEPRLSRHAAHRPFDLLYLRPGGHLVRAIRLQAGWFVHFAAALVQAKKLHIVRGPSSNFAIRHMAGKGF